MSSLPHEVLERIEARDGEWSSHATDARRDLGLGWNDVVSVAQTAATWKRETDEMGVAVDGWKDSVTGRDTYGRELYMTGKWVYFEGENCWYVITIHQLCKEKAQRPKRRESR